MKHKLFIQIKNLGNPEITKNPGSDFYPVNLEIRKILVQT